MNAAPILGGSHPHGAFQRHPIPPAGRAGEIHGNPAQDRPAPSPRQAVHRTTAAPPAVAVYAVGDAPPADVFARHAGHRAATERAERWRDRLHGAGIAAALLMAVAAAVALGNATAGPIRPHVASIEVAR